MHLPLCTCDTLTHTHLSSHSHRYAHTQGIHADVKLWSDTVMYCYVNRMQSVKKLLVTEFATSLHCGRRRKRKCLLKLLLFLVYLLPPFRLYFSVPDEVLKVRSNVFKFIVKVNSPSVTAIASI